ncbi:unnamed protein product [Gordionus sp. m RMFG-2023]
MGNSRFCYSFLVRDTPDDFINVTYWGSSETNDTASSRFKIGDLVDILCAEIEPKTENFTEFKYKPWTPVSFHLSIKEKQGQIITLKEDYYKSQFPNSHCSQSIAINPNIIKCPNKPATDCYTISEILANSDDLVNVESLNLLGIVKKMFEPKNLTLKSNSESKLKCEIIVCDEAHQSLMIVIWEEAIIDWVMKWKFDIPLMLFASDLQLKFNTFRKAYVLNTTHKTVFTFDPDIPEYRDKYLNLIKEGSLVNVHMFMEDEDDEIVTDISKFVEIPTVIQLISIVDKRFEDSSLINQSDLRESDTSPKWDKFYCVLRAHVSNFDIDTELMEKVIAWKCQICNCKINEIKLKKLFLQKNENGRRASVMKKLCTNIKCQSYKSFEQIKGLKIDANDDIDSDVYPIYNIKMNISDYTGTLVNCGIVSTKTRSLIDLKVIKR